ncbi:mitoferrin [Nilaparvata lugens]|uniref:mitoferrin n=1 Tax=Nilaparvata lugens TaxID=108931 RepID=UPI00193CEDA8|nr:mitoferrin [Nilaparvata lugens]
MCEFCLHNMENGEDVYNSLKGATFLIHLISGSVAGMLEYSIFYPLDTVKTRMQDLTHANKSVFRTMVNMCQNEGPSSLFRGMTIFAGGSAPAHGMYFVAYEYFKVKMSSHFNKNIAYGLSGAIATTVHDGLMVPIEAIKQRRQVEGSPYKSNIDCIVKMYKQEGIRSFYRSFTTQLLMNIPFQSVHFIVYEWASHALSPEEGFNPLSHATAGAIAGALAAFITNPLDVSKTLLNTQKHEEKVVGVWNAMKKVYAVAGPSGYFRGATARILHVMPATGICWGTYESMKYGLKRVL